MDTMNDTYIIELVDADEADEHNGFTLMLVQDEDAESANPRQDTNLGLFLGFEHRNYEIGDKRVDGDLVHHANKVASRLKGKSTAAERRAAFYEIIARAIKRQYGARVVVTVGMLDHSGLHFYAGGGAHWSDSHGWDSGTCGFIFDTPETLKETGFEGTDEELRAALVSEIEVYNQWQSGEVFGYVISRGGEEVEACWGIVGERAAEEEAEAALKYLVESCTSLADEWFASYVEAYTS